MFAAATSTSAASTGAVTDRDAFADHDLTAEDWQLLMEGARQSVFPPGTSIVVGTNVALVHQIVSGSVRMVASRAPATTLCTLSEGDFVGETELVSPSLCGDLSYVTESSVETVGFVVDVLRVLFVNKPDLCGRFFRFLSVSLAVRTREVSALLAGLAAPDTEVVPVL